MVREGMGREGKEGGREGREREREAREDGDPGFKVDQATLMHAWYFHVTHPHPHEVNDKS